MQVKLFKPESPKAVTIKCQITTFGTLILFFLILKIIA